MARTASPAPGQPPFRRTDARPTAIDLQQSRQLKHHYSAIEKIFCLFPLDPETLIMAPESIQWGFDRQSDCEWYEGTTQWRCWKTCVTFEFINERHPRLADYAGCDSWTNLPLFKTPSGPSLDIFLQHHKSLIYSTIAPYRPNDKYVPILYQWTLHLLSAIDFIHSHKVVLGHFDLCNCWLSATLDLSLVGFPSATFRSDRYPVPFPSRTQPWGPFHPLYETSRRQRVKPSIETDLVLFGDVVCQLMTTYWPGDDPRMDRDNLHALHVRGEWPELETKYLGEIAQKCWRRQYRNAQEAKADLVGVLTAEGYGIEGDSLVGVDAVEIMGDDMKGQYRRIVE